MNPTLLAYNKAIANKYNINEDQAFEILSAGLVLGLPFDEVYENIWVGATNDCGFDAIYLDESSNLIYLFQAKNTPELSENAIMKLETDFMDLFVGNNKSGRKMNEKIESIMEEYLNISQKGTVLIPKFNFTYSGNKIDTTRPKNLEITERFENRSSGPEFSIIDSEKLLQMLTTLQRGRNKDVHFTFRPENTNIQTYSNQDMYSFVIGQIGAVSFRIKATQLCELVKKEIEINGFMDTLFSENVRGYLGKNKANKRMISTLKNRERAPFFPFLNNGLTIVCQSLTIPSLPQATGYLLPVVNPIIVNGLQTTRVIYDIFIEDPSLLEDVYVTLKVYESRDTSLTEMITEATNTQTSISFKDQMSNKEFNEHTTAYFASNKVKYISKRGQIVRGDDLTEGLQDSINNEMVLKFWYATYYKKPHIAKISKTTILENIFLATKGDYPDLNELFSGDPKSCIYSQLFNAYRIQKYIAHKRNNTLITNPEKDYLLHADEIMAYGIFLELESIGKSKDFSDNEIKNVYAKIQLRIEKLVEDEKNKRLDLYAHTKYFKSDSIVQDYEQLI